MFMVEAMGFSTQLILRALQELGAPHTPVTYAQIANHIGCSTVTVWRVMTVLMDEKVVRRSGGPRGYIYEVNTTHA